MTEQVKTRRTPMRHALTGCCVLFVLLITLVFVPLLQRRSSVMNSTRRSQCKKLMAQLSIALLSFESSTGQFTAGIYGG